MKKALLTIAAIMLLAGPASAQMLSIWADADATVGCLDGIPMYNVRSIYLFLEPGPWGATAVEYMLETPGPNPGDYFMAGLPTYCAGYNATLGGLLDAPCAITFSCKQATFWVVMMPIMYGATANPSGYLAIVDNPDVETIQIADCNDEAGRPKHPCSVYNYFGWNAECYTGTKDASWGAIKSMF